MLGRRHGAGGAGQAMGEGPRAELMRALVDPRVAWATARRGDPRPDWWYSFVLGLLVLMFASFGAFLLASRALSRVVATHPDGLFPVGLVLSAAGFFFLAAAAGYFVLILVAAISRVLDP